MSNKNLLKEINHGPMVEMNHKYFRPRTKWHQITINFVLSQGGLGDYLSFLPAFEWIENENPHVKARLFTKEPFYTVAKQVLKKTEICFEHEWKLKVKKGDGICNASQFQTYVNATGSHLIDLGFMFFANTAKAYPDYNRLPRIEGTEPDFDLPDSYAVFTPGYTSETRKMKPEYFNELVRYTRSKGVEPVFLGRKNFIPGTPNYEAKFDGYDLTQGLDLTEKTTLLEAVYIMSRSKFVLGLDNGLLHFAGCTEVPIIFGHTITEVSQREIRRPRGKTYNIAVEPKVLPCIGCQANMRFIVGHKFTKCIYDDYLCLDALFANDCYKWKEAICTILEG